MTDAIMQVAVKAAARELARIAGSRSGPDNWEALRPLGGNYTSIENYVDRRWDQHVWVATSVVISIFAALPEGHP